MSYAGEDTKFATELAGALKSRGLAIWYAPVELKVGSRLLDSIERGMQDSKSAILLISPAYLQKGWTNYEMDTLIRQHIEGGKKLFPLWHGVGKEDVEARHAGLAGIVALPTNRGLQALTDGILEVLSDHARTIGVIPSWEVPAWRFLKGRGEIHVGSDQGPATTLWEFLLHATEGDYPLHLAGSLYTRDDLLFNAAQLLPHMPHEVKGWVGKKGFEALWDMCVAAGLDPKRFQ